jgi:hypothetical protein
MARHGQSCAVPLEMPGFTGPAEDDCKHCTDQRGELEPADEVRAGIATWLKSWPGALDEGTALARADHSMKATSAWGE